MGVEGPVLSFLHASEKKLVVVAPMLSYLLPVGGTMKESMRRVGGVSCGTVDTAVVVRGVDVSRETLMFPAVLQVKFLHKSVQFPYQRVRQLLRMLSRRW